MIWVSDMDCREDKAANKAALDRMEFELRMDRRVTRLTRMTWLEYLELRALCP